VRWYSRYTDCFDEKVPTFITCIKFHWFKIYSSKNFDISISPLFWKLIQPLSNKLSIWGDSNKPLLPSNFSLSFETDQSFIWLAIKKLGLLTPVIRQRVSLSRTLVRKMPCPRCDCISCSFCVGPISVRPSTDFRSVSSITIWSSSKIAEKFDKETSAFSSKMFANSFEINAR